MTLLSIKGERNEFIYTKSSLRPEYGIFFKHQDFLMPGLHRMHHLVVLELPKESGLLLDPSAPPDCDNRARYKLNDLVKNTHSEVCHPFRKNSYQTQGEKRTI